MTATRERIERIAWETANLLADQYQNSRPCSLAGETPKPVEIVVSALTALCEEMERESFVSIIPKIVQRMEDHSWEIIGMVSPDDVTGNRQECPVFGHEYVDQSGPGILGDDFHGYIHVPIGGQYLKIWYST